MRFGTAAVPALMLALAASAATPAPLLDRSGDRIVERADITSRGGEHGEVRLVDRGSARVVQTLLYTKLLRRVVGEIRNRESANWPADRDGHDASVLYLEALERAERSVPRPPTGHRGAAAERRRPLLIEFAASRSDQAVLLLGPRLEESDGKLTVVDASLIESLDLPRDFVLRDMRLIAEEHFGESGEALAWLLAPFEPAAQQDLGQEKTRDDEH